MGRSIPRSDRNDLEVLLNQFHASEELQARCKTVEINARQYLSLDLDEDLGQRYKATILIPTGKYLAVYFGSLERARLGEEDTLNHSMAQGKLDFKYELIIDGTPRRGDTHPGRLQLVNHCCEPDNNSVCEEWSCPDTGLTAFFLRSVRDIPPDVEVKFPYQKPTFKNGVQVYPANHFWKEALALPSVRKGWHLVQCNCAGTPGHCPNGYGRNVGTPPPPPPTTATTATTPATPPTPPTPATPPTPPTPATTTPAPTITSPPTLTSPTPTLTSPTTTLTSLTTTFISTTTTTTRSRASSAKRGPAAPRPSNFPR